MHKPAIRSTSGAPYISIGGMTGGGGGSGSGVPILKPPKPPCWRDFVTQESGGSVRKDHHSSLSSTSPFPEIRIISDLVTSGGGGGDNDIGDGGGSSRLTSSQGLGGGAGMGGLKPPRLAKRVRAKIHRTRSEHLIALEELPEGGELTVRLADTRPHELRLRAPPAADLDERLYTEENNRRCQNWLASIEAAEPLDEIGYNGSSSGGSSSGGKNLTSSSNTVSLETVDVEVPEETFSWVGDDDLSPGDQDGRGGGDLRLARRGKRLPQLKPPINTSASSSDSDGLLQHVMAAVGYAAHNDDDDDDNHGYGNSDKDGAQSPKSGGGGGVCSGGGGGGGSSSGSGMGKGRCGLRATSSSLNVHRRLSSKHILPFPEHTGLE